MKHITRGVSSIVSKQMIILDFSPYIKYSTLYFCVGIMVRVIAAAYFAQQQGVLVALSLLSIYGMLGRAFDFLIPYTRGVSWKTICKALVIMDVLFTCVHATVLYDVELWVHSMIILGLFNSVISHRWGIQYDDILSRGANDRESSHQYTFSDVQDAEIGAFNVAGVIGGSLAAAMYWVFGETNITMIQWWIAVTSTFPPMMAYYNYKNYWCK